ncbi:MAG: serine hydrolase domain-containing protein, partial [Bacteroidota bacterium]
LNVKLPFKAVIFKVNDGMEIKSTVRIQYTTPERMGIQKKKLAQIDSIAKKGINDKCYPGCRIIALKDGKVFYDKSFGNHSYGSSEKVNFNTIYDVASVTKISATALALMKLHGERKLDVNKKFGDYLPECRGTNKEDLILSEVMTHQSGLPAWIPFYKRSLGAKGTYKPGYYSDDFSKEYPYRVREGLYSAKTIKDTVYSQILNCNIKDKGKYLYSDLGYYLHQRIIEKMCNLTLDSFLTKFFYLPLGLQTIGYKPYRRFSKDKIAPTENDKEFRKSLLRGDVHDQGAALLGGVAGHAGIFSNANDLAVIMQMLLNKGTYGGERFLDSNSVKLFAWKNFYVGNRRGLCFEKPDPDRKKEGPVTAECSLESFGHSGFTGTFVWADPKNQLIYIFLSNRVHPDATSNKLFSSGIRPKIHKLLYEAIANTKPPFDN